jgi:hypothetical protein
VCRALKHPSRWFLARAGDIFATLPFDGFESGELVPVRDGTFRFAVFARPHGHSSCRPAHLELGMVGSLTALRRVSQRHYRTVLHQNVSARLREPASARGQPGFVQTRAVLSFFSPHSCLYREIPVGTEQYVTAQNDTARPSSRSRILPSRTSRSPEPWRRGACSHSTSNGTSAACSSATRSGPRGTVKRPWARFPSESGFV